MEGRRASDEARAGIKDWATLGGGSALALYGMSRSTRRVPYALAGLALTFYGITRRAKTGSRVRPKKILATKSVTVRRPIAEVYGFWRDFSDLPKVMHHLRAVEKTADDRYRFTLSPPYTRRTVKWEAEIIEQRTNELIRWQSVPGSPLLHTGTVLFEPAPEGRGTEVHVTMEYRPGTGGSGLGSFLTPAMAQMIKEEIRRFKEFMEAGEVPTIEGQPSARG